jgi:hypothetical protein
MLRGLPGGNKSVGGSKGVCPLGRRAGVDAPAEKGRQGASMEWRRPSEGGKRSCSPSELTQDRRQRMRPDVDKILKRINYILGILEKIADCREDFDFGEAYADLVGLMHKVKRHSADTEIMADLNDSLSSISSKLARLFKKEKRKPKVRVIKVGGNTGNQPWHANAVVGIEMNTPLVGDRYLVLRERGAVYLTSTVTKILDGCIHTRNSVYRIEVMNG